MTFMLAFVCSVIQSLLTPVRMTPFWQVAHLVFLSCRLLLDLVCRPLVPTYVVGGCIYNVHVGHLPPYLILMLNRNTNSIFNNPTVTANATLCAVVISGGSDVCGGKYPPIRISCIHCFLDGHVKPESLDNGQFFEWTQIWQEVVSS